MAKKSLTQRIAPLTLGVVLAVLTATGLTGCVPQPKFCGNHTYIIKGGDTLWDIVKTDPYYNKYDIGRVIWDIRKENGIDNPGLIRSGQEIYMPRYDDSKFKIF